VNRKQRNNMETITVVKLAEKFNLIQDYWQPRIAGELNHSYVKLAKIKGEFVWHHHELEDELFLVVKGRLIIQLKTGDIILNPGEFVIIPKGIEHRPVAEEEVQIILIEPKTTLNTGNLHNEHTTTADWI